MSGEAAASPEVTKLIESGWIGRRAQREIIEWTRAWNLAHPQSRVRIVGVDAQENVQARATVRAFVQSAYGDTLTPRWNAAEKELTVADEQTAVFGDSGVEISVRNFLVELRAMLDLDAPILRARFGSGALEAAQEASSTLAQFADFNAEGNGQHSRDWYMAANVLAALERDPSSRTVYWAHNAHVAAPHGTMRTAGAILRSVLGCEYGAVAVTFGEGSFVAQIPNDAEDRLVVSTLPPAVDESIESVLASLPLVTWPCDTDVASTPEWLRSPHSMHWVGGLFAPGTLPSAAVRQFDLVRDFDVVAFVPRVTADEMPSDRPHIAPRRR